MPIISADIEGLLTNCSKMDKALISRLPINHNIQYINDINSMAF